MLFKKKVPIWKNEGVEPPEELKNSGFKAGYKPPASYFNWFFNRIEEAVKELQEQLTVSLKALAFKDQVGDGDIIDMAASKVIQDNTHRMLTDIERKNWDDANTKKHTHDNISILKKITQALLDNWNNAYIHINDTVKHITPSERKKWNEIESVKESLEKYASMTVVDGVLNLPGGGDIAVTGEILTIPLKI